MESTARTPRTATARRRPAAARVRWDRIARCTLLVVLFGVLLLYIGPARNYLSTYHQAQHARAQVATLEQQNRQLRDEQRALRGPLAVSRAARRLGMVKAGERPFVVQGLPSSHGR
jgi:cell division protein FtsB